MKFEADEKAGPVGEALRSFLDSKRYRVTLGNGWYKVWSWHWFFGYTSIMSISANSSTVLMHKAQRLDGCRIIESLESLLKRLFVVKFYEDYNRDREAPVRIL